MDVPRPQSPPRLMRILQVVAIALGLLGQVLVLMGSAIAVPEVGELGQAGRVGLASWSEHSNKSEITDLGMDIVLLMRQLWS